MKLSKLRGQSVMAGLEWNPLIMGRRALAEGNYPEAVALLRQAITNHRGGFEAQVLLAGALARQGDLAGAQGWCSRWASRRTTPWPATAAWPWPGPTRTPGTAASPA